MVRERVVGYASTTGVEFRQSTKTVHGHTVYGAITWESTGISLFGKEACRRGIMDEIGERTNNFCKAFVKANPK